ncbi:hypothetical protein GGQ74_001251 [Desulfobaculum xiamenense]|uniref:Uncharacterized protein n=1 Tax=Desulfobaculum xiamenense TaxID=995050 RepID=A0A846QHB7_9BACT|nr:hypothetical protein [Desulfobaculum xiamenense]NJB67611.1 hypothetical protein [Desulfobaculum xiamenense]
MKPSSQSVVRSTGAGRLGLKIAYFAAGIVFIPLSRFFVPFWVRFPILALWAVGLAVMLARHLSRPDEDRSRPRG